MNNLVFKERGGWFGGGVFGGGMVGRCQGYVGGMWGVVRSTPLSVVWGAPCTHTMHTHMYTICMYCTYTIEIPHNILADVVRVRLIMLIACGTNLCENIRGCCGFPHTPLHTHSLIHTLPCIHIPLHTHTQKNILLMCSPLLSYHNKSLGQCTVTGRSSTMGCMSQGGSHDGGSCCGAGGCV